MDRSIKQVTRGTSNNHAKNEFIGQRTCIENAGIEIANDTNRSRDKYHQQNVVGEQAKGRAGILDIEDGQVIANDWNGRITTGRTQVLDN
jgi:hypothetical protein